MALKEGYSPRNRAERVISAGRLFLSICLAVASALGPVTSEAREVLYTLSVSYVLYSAGIFVLTWTRGVTAASIPLITHIVDLVVFSVLMFMTDAPTSPFFAYFVFAVIAATIRWQGRGALLTAATVVPAYVALTVGSTLVMDGEFEGGPFVARLALLLSVAALLAYVGRSQFRLQREIAGLAAWPRRLPTGSSSAVQEVLTYAAEVLRAPRVVLTWTEEDEPSLRVAMKAGDRFEISREPPDVFGTLVAERLERSSFACSDAAKPRSDVLYRVPGGFKYWRGAPLDERFLQRFDVTSVLALRLSADMIEGRLFALDRPRFSDDDLLLGDVVGRLVSGALELHVLVEQLREGAAGEERLRLARELHDGILQSLTAASLHVQRARQSVSQNRADAEQRLAMVEETLLSEHQSLRLAIAGLQPGDQSDPTTVDSVAHIRETAMRIARQWDIRVHLNLQRDIMPLPPRIVHELTRMVQEALVNAIRHGGAKEATVTCVASSDQLMLAVSYEGRGFASFRGRHNLASLNGMQAGPRTLKQRVAALGGTLEIESGERGARVEIGIPVMPAR